MIERLKDLQTYIDMPTTNEIIDRLMIVELRDKINELIDIVNELREDLGYEGDTKQEPPLTINE